MKFCLAQPTPRQNPGSAPGSFSLTASSNKGSKRLPITLTRILPKARTSPNWHNEHLVLARHSLLQPKPHPKGHFPRHGSYPKSHRGQCPPRDVRDLPSHVRRGLVWHIPWLLVHCLLHRIHRSVLHPVSWILHDDHLHVHYGTQIRLP